MEIKYIYQRHISTEGITVYDIILFWRGERFLYKSDTAMCVYARPGGCENLGQLSAIRPFRRPYTANHYQTVDRKWFISPDNIHY